MTRLEAERNVWPKRARKERQRRRAKAKGGPAPTRPQNYGVPGVQQEIVRDVLAHRDTYGHLGSPPPPPILKPLMLNLDGRPIRNRY